MSTAKNMGAPRWKKLLVSAFRLKKMLAMTRTMVEFPNNEEILMLGSALEAQSDLRYV